MAENKIFLQINKFTKNFPCVKALSDAHEKFGKALQDIAVNKLCEGIEEFYKIQRKLDKKILNR